MEDSMEVKEDEEERGERVKVNIEDGCEDNMCDNQELMGYDEDPIFQEFTDWKVLSYYEDRFFSYRQSKKGNSTDKCFARITPFSTCF